MMDKRIAYGCTLDEAIEIAKNAITDLSEENKRNILHVSIGGGIIWAESRPDGWRVYRPKKSPEEMHTDDTTIIGSFKSDTLRMDAVEMVNEAQNAEAEKDMGIVWGESRDRHKKSPS